MMQAELHHYLLAISPEIPRVLHYAMLDSGATNNFINSTFLAETNIQKIKKKNPLQLQVIDGRPIKSGAVTHNTCPIQILTQDHKETVSFDITTLGDYPVILGLPWLSHHNPNINWINRTIDLSSVTTLYKQQEI
nr:hypothetical protein L203_06646 [Cryptococcus depauperatus CBS 7841]